MGVEDHKEAAGTEAVAVRILVVSTSRTPASDTTGPEIQTRLETAGHRVLERLLVNDDADAIGGTLDRLAAGGATQAVILTGGTGVSGRDVTTDALDGRITRDIPGFGELFRMLSYQQVGSAAMLSRASAGMIGPMAVFSIPGSPAAVELAMDKLILPELRHVVHQASKEPHDHPAPGAVAKTAPKAEPPPSPKKADKPTLPPPSGSIGHLGRTKVGVGSVQDLPGQKTDVAASSADLPSGWQRAIYEVSGKLTKGGWPPIPEELEKVQPVMDILHGAGQKGLLELPGGRTYSIFGFPDLEANNSKVIAMADAYPLPEIVVLSRYPVLTGVLVDTGGLLPSRRDDVAATCEAITGRVPKDRSGQLMAVQGDAVWIARGTRAIKWDGNRETDDGTIKQALATMLLSWVSR
jgi:molybdenum cofactor biosynthesis protein B